MLGLFFLSRALSGTRMLFIDLVFSSVSATRQRCTAGNH
jgi:hypothetical protein